MPIIENTYGRELDELHKAVKTLDKALDIRGRQEGAIYLQSYHLIQDAARLYEENDRLRELCAVMRAKTPVLCGVVGCRDSCPNTALCEREAELVRELGIEVGK